MTGRQGLVIKSTGSWYRVKLKSGELLDCRLKGKFRLKSIDSTNPVAVGDDVMIEGSGGKWVISEILNRRNYIIRKSNNLSRQSQIIASNLDLVLLMVTISQPRTSLGFIDRYLLICELYGVDVLLFWNKTDLYQEEENILLKEFSDIYKNIGYGVVMGNIHDGQVEKDLLSAISGRTTLLAGHSGVGKSSWLNRLIPDLDQKTGEVSSAHHKGKHTTTFAEMFFGAGGMQIIDTPGIKDFGMVSLERREVQFGFREFQKIRHLCRFNDCAHVDEPDCAILKALNDANITESRYYNYLSILETI